VVAGLLVLSFGWIPVVIIVPKLLPAQVSYKECLAKSQGEYDAAYCAGRLAVDQ
jgi:hypothetical protein